MKLYIVTTVYRNIEKVCEVESANETRAAIDARYVRAIEERRSNMRGITVKSIVHKI